MEPVTTHESPRNTWPARKVRLDDQRWKAARVKLANDEESWQAVMEAFAVGWISGELDVNEVRDRLRARGLLPPPEE